MSLNAKPWRPSLPTIQSSYYGQNPHSASLKEKVGEILGTGSGDLPMYKDKPNFPHSRRRSGAGNKIGLLLLLILAMLYFSGILRIPMSFSGGESRGDPWGLSTTSETWVARKEAVKEAFITSWDHYAEHAWGMDEFHPVAQTGRNMGCRPGATVCPPVGWIIVDGLDTAIMMNLTSRVAKAREWISTSLDFSKPDSDTNTFETTIRVLGGLLSAHYLSTTFPHLAPLSDDDIGAKGEDLYIEKAVDLADRLLGAYDTKTGIPLSSIILSTSTGKGSFGDAGAASTAEATTLQLEMKYVAKLTGEPLYWERAEAVMEAVDAPRQQDGLLPIFVNPQTGVFEGNNIRLGSRGDSYYEYLVKQYLQTGSREGVYREMWEEALAGMKKHLITWSPNANLTILGERQSGLNGKLTPKMDHLACFLPGTIALAVTGGDTVSSARTKAGSNWGRNHEEENLVLAEELMRTCWTMYAGTPTGLAAEITYLEMNDPPPKWNPNDDHHWIQPRSLTSDLDNPKLNNGKGNPKAAWRSDLDIHALDTHNLQRPETAESLFYMYRITRDPKYREWGWIMFQNFVKHTSIHDPQTGKVLGYTSIDDINKLYNGGSGADSQNKLQIMTGNHGTTIHRDSMEGFWLSETLKYFYLLFSDPDLDEDGSEAWHDLTNVVINTEAHFFPRFDIGKEGEQKVWKTGWKRKERRS